MNSKALPAMILIALATATCLPAAPETEEARTIVITANDSLKFSVTHIEARPGEKLHVQFRNAGTLPKAVMGHNWVLLKAGSDAMPYN